MGNTEEAGEEKSSKRSWYAWVVFGAAFLAIFVSYGFGSSTKGTFLPAVTGSLALARSAYTIGDTLRYLTTAVMSLFFGRAMKKIGLRTMALVGFLLMTLSFVTSACAPYMTNAFCAMIPESMESLRDFMRYLPFYFSGILLGAGFAWGSVSVASVLVRNWFASGQGTMTGIVLSANGFGGFVSEIVVTRIVFGADGSLSNETSRWQAGFFVIAGLMLLTGILVWLLFRNEPADIGQTPFQLKESQKRKTKTDEWDGIAHEEAFRNPWFYLAGFGFFLLGFTIQSMSNIAKPYIYDLGYDKNFVITVFSVHSLALLAAKALTGIGNDTIGIRKTYAVLTFASVTAFLALFFLPVPGSGAFGEVLFPWIYSIFSSLGLPLESVMVSLLTAYLFGKKDFAHILGYCHAFTTLGCAIGAPVVNIFYDLQGTYKWIVLILAILVFLTAVLHESIMFHVNRKYRLPAARR